MPLPIPSRQQGRARSCPRVTRAPATGLAGALLATWVAMSTPTAAGEEPSPGGATGGSPPAVAAPGGPAAGTESPHAVDTTDRPAPGEAADEPPAEDDAEGRAPVTGEEALPPAEAMARQAPAGADDPPLSSDAGESRTPKAAEAGPPAGSEADRCGAPLAPVLLRYRVSDDRKERGEAEAVLSRVDATTWRYEVTTRGRAGIIPVKHVETSEFTWVDGWPRPLRYERITSAGPLRRRSDAVFDWAAGEARGTHKGDDWSLAIADGDLDRQLIQLAAARQLAAGDRAIALRFVDRGRARTVAVPDVQEVTISTGPDQSWRTWLVDRDAGDDVTRVWHGIDAQLLPVRVEHIDREEDQRWQMDLVELIRLPCERDE